MYTKAIWRGVVIAESDRVEKVGGDIYFPFSSIKRRFFAASKKNTKHPELGTANYYHIIVNGVINQNAAWYYSNPKQKYVHIKNYIAFWQGIVIN